MSKIIRENRRDLTQSYEKLAKRQTMHSQSNTKTLQQLSITQRLRKFHFISHPETVLKVWKQCCSLNLPNISARVIYDALAILSTMELLYSTQLIANATISKYFGQFGTIW